MGARVAASGPAFDGRWVVSRSILGRIVAGAAVHGPRPRARPVRIFCVGRAVSAAQVSLAEPPGGPEPARPWHRHPPSPSDGAVRYAGHAGSGRAGAVAGTARTHFGINQAYPRRPA